MSRRTFALYLIIIIFSAAITVRLFALQVLSHDFYQELAENQHQLYQTLVPVRGEVFIRDGQNGELVAAVTNIEKDLVYAVPPEIEDKAGTAAKLASLLGLSQSAILEKLSQEDRQWVALKKQLPDELAQTARQLDLDGIYLQPEALRFYPEREFAAQLLGFMAYREDARVGQYGVEAYYEDLLAGQSGTLAIEKDAFGRWITRGLRRLQAAENGADIILTLNRAIQFKAENILKKTVELHQADRGSMVVLDRRSGAVLATAIYPSFDPNKFNEIENPAVYRNLAVSDTYEPGSVFKPVTMAGALEAGVITPDLTYEDEGYVVIDKYTIKNADNKTHGIQTMTQVLEQSINTGAIFAQDQLGPEKFLETVKNFGFGTPTGIALPAEAGGNISNLVGGGDVHYATASFGQGITATLLQIAQAFGAIANEGKLMKPYIVEQIQYSDGRVEELGSPVGRQIISPRVANTLAAMLVSVVENGHGKRAGVPGYYVAGKTGTAQVVNPAGGYDPNVTIGTFAGFAPVSDPKFVMAVRIDNPKTVRFAESTAAPAFGEMAQFLLNYYQIPTSR